MCRAFGLLIGLLTLPSLAGEKVAEGIPGIVFVGAPMFDPRTDGGEGVFQGSYHWRDGYIYPRSATFHRGERTMGPPRPGRNLYSLTPARPDGKLTRLTHLKSGAVFKPEPHFDGTKVLFSMRRDGEDWFHLYEVNIDGTGLRQLTDGPFNDFAGTYLPDGRIVFCSDRTGYLEEYHEERTECLFLMKGDGTGIEQITFLPGTYFEPTVLRDGRILFSFWDAFHIDVPPFDKHETYLMTVNPDGTEERHFFGSGQYRYFERERHSGIGLTQAREMPDGRILVQSEMGPALLDPRAGPSVREALAAIFPGTTSVQVGGTTHRSHLSPLGTRSTPYPLQDGRFLLSRTLPGARDSGIFVCDPDTREEQLIVNLPNFAEFDPVPVLTKRPLPQQVPPSRAAESSRPAGPAGDFARFLIVAGHASDQPQRSEAMKKARFFRVVEAEYSGVTTSSHTSLETRILGVVPVFPDGSSYFEAPADTPIFLDPLDAAGNRILLPWPYEDTAVPKGSLYSATQMAYMSARPFEMRSCYGCHPPGPDAVPNVKVEALRHDPVRITRDSTDIQYRRNEPEAYRRQARLGDEVKYRAWLKSNDAVVRTRGCEMLMYLEDAAASDVTTVAGLLQDESVEVKRAAALALTRLGTSAQQPALEKAVADTDWFVKFAAESALAAIRGEDALTHYEGLARQPANDRSLGLVRKELAKSLPELGAVRAAGRLKDAQTVKLLAPWLRRHEHEYHAAEAALALGRIGTKEAIDALLAALRSEVPNKAVVYSRYFQHGPRPEEYAILKALLIANARLELDDLYLLFALLPNTFMEKPRFEDRMRAETQRVLMPRLLLERSGFRRRIVHLLLASQERKRLEPDDQLLLDQVLKGINLERPFAEHQRPFDVVKELRGEEILWLLGVLIEPAVDLEGEKRQAFEDSVVPYLTSKHFRERIDAAVLLGVAGFSKKAARVLADEARKPYDFPEITSIGQGIPGGKYRDKAYLAMALARQTPDLGLVAPLIEPRTMARDIRYGIVRGLMMRAKADAIPLLIDMATRDPLTLVRQQARNALAEIGDVYLLAGKPIPRVEVPTPESLEKLYPPRGLSWSDTTFEELPRVEKLSLRECLTPDNFRDLSNAQIFTARHMMIGHVEETRRAFAGLEGDQGGGNAKALQWSLDSPYPFAHYMAAEKLAETGEDKTLAGLANRLGPYLKANDTVGFWWTCETLTRKNVRSAIPIVKKWTSPANPPGTFGPSGMAVGYQAARTLCRLVGDIKNADADRLLRSKNVWLRAGALRGLAEAHAEGIELLLREALDEEEPAQVRQEARVQLRHRKR